MKLLAVFGGYRPEKTLDILPYSGLEYEVLFPRVRKWGYMPLPLKLLAVLVHPIRQWVFIHVRAGTRRMIRDFQPDLMYTNSGSITSADVTIARQEGVPVAVRLGGHIYEEMRENTRLKGLTGLLWRMIYLRHYRRAFQTLKQAAYILTVTEDMADRLARESGRDRRDISVVRVPCNISKFDLPKIPHTGKVILTVTNATFKSKALPIAEAVPFMSLLLRDHPEWEWRVFAFGRHSYLVNKAVWQAMNRQITFQGFTKNVVAEYRKADVLLYLSDLDGCPNVILESWASHVPVVVNRCSWSEEVVGDRGLLVNEGDDIATHIERLLKDDSLRGEVTDRGYQYLIAHHTKYAAGEHLGEVMRARWESD